MYKCCSVMGPFLNFPVPVSLTIYLRNTTSAALYPILLQHIKFKTKKLQSLCLCSRIQYVKQCFFFKYFLTSTFSVYTV